MQVTKCGDALCSAGNTVSSVDSDSDYANAMLLPSDGVPIVAYYGRTSSPGLRVAKCGDAACSSNNVVSTLDAQGNASYANGAIGASAGHTTNAQDGALKMVVCSKADCSP